MTDSIKPPHAISLWVSNDVLYAELPSTTGQQSHTLRLPNNVWGLTQLLNTLKTRTSQSRLGEAGDPTQFQSDKAIKEMGRLAAGYQGTVKKPLPKLEVTPERRSLVRDLIRRIVTP